MTLLSGLSKSLVTTLKHCRCLRYCKLRAARTACHQRLSETWRCYGNSSTTSTGDVIGDQLRHRSVVEACGDDVLPFLQGLLTNDVQRLDLAGSAMYAMMLNVQGRVMYDLILYRLSADTPTILIECQRDVAADVVRTLQRYKLRKSVTIADASDRFSVWALFTDTQSLTDVQLNSDSVIISTLDPRHASFGMRLLLPPSVNLADVTPGSYHAWRCRRGIGEGTVDFPPSQSFPLECNVDFMNGVSFSKGCYIGQELTARTNYTGVIRKRIMPLVLSSVTADIKPSTAVLVNSTGKECGKLRSIVGCYALGLLRIDDVVGKGKLDVRVNESKVAEAHTEIPSWWPTSSDAIVQQAVAKTVQSDSMDQHDSMPSR